MKKIAERGADFLTAARPVWLSPCSGGYVLAVHVQPGARRSAVLGEHGDRLKLAVKAPPVDGRANQAVLELLGETLDLPRRALTLEAGEASRDKRVRVATPITPEEMLRRLAPK